MTRTIVLSFGLPRRTREVLDRARRYGHDIHLVAAIPSATRGLRRHRSSLVTVHDEVGRAGLAAALGTGTETVLLLHEDVLLDPAAAARLVDVATELAQIAVPATNHQDVDGDTGVLPPDVVQPLGPLREPVPVERFRNVCLAAPADRLVRLLHHRLTAASTRLYAATGAVLVAEAIATHLDEGPDQLEAPVGPDGRPLLVAAMIVRDEEQFLPGCLASLDGLVDRIELVDTGSTDRTVEIAEEAGAVVHHAPWRDDFGWARNQALDRCRDAWWVLQVDADERVRLDDPEAFRRFLATALPDRDGFDVPLRDVAADGTELGGQQLPRLFPAEGTEYVGRVHEVARYDDGRLLPWTIIDQLEIEHHGYQSEVIASRDKHARNLALARADHAEDPTPVAMLQLARSLRLEPKYLPELLDVLGELHQLVQMGTDGLNEVGHIPTYQLYAQSLLLDGRPDDAWAVITEGLERYPHSPILRAVHARIGGRTGRHEEVTAAAAVPDGQAARPWVDAIADATVTLQGALSRLAVDDLDGAGAAIESLLRDGVPSTLGRWGEIVAVVALSRPDQVVELLRPAAIADGSGDALRAIGLTFDPLDAAGFAAEVLQHGDAPSAEQVAAALGLAVAADAPDELQRVLAHTDITPEEVLHRLDTPPPAIASWLALETGGPAAGATTAALHTGDDDQAVTLVTRDRSGAAIRELARVEDPGTAARIVAAAVRRGATSSAQLRAALAVAVISRDHDVADALSPHLHDLGDEVIEASVQRALANDAVDVAGRIAAGLFPPLPAPPEAASTAATTAIARVLGMHRSGTSSYALVARRLGADVGPEHELIPAAPDNPRGFHEHRPLVLVADRLLQLLGGTWDAPPDITADLASDPDVLAIVRGAAATLDRFLELASGVALWKDPRTSLLLDLWSAVLADREVAVHDVHVVRAPDAVVASLARRSGMHPEHAARLWVRYVGDTCRARPEATLFHARELLADPRGTAERLAPALGLPPPDAAALDAAATAVDAALQQEPDDAAPAGPWLTAARDLHDLLRGGEAVAAADAAADAIDRLTPGAAERGQPLAVLAPAHRPADLGPPGGPATLWLPSPTKVAAYEASSLGWSPIGTPLSTVVQMTTPRAVWFDGTAEVEPVVVQTVRTSPRTRLAAARDHTLLDEVVAMDAAPTWLAQADRVAQLPQRIGAVPSRDRADMTSIVIPVHGNWELTDRCLAALRADVDEPIEVIVVDDASPDDTAERLAVDDRVDVIVSLPENRGFPGAVNAGLARATGQRICILNNDTLPMPGWLTALRRELDQDGVVLVGPRSNEISGPQRVADAPTTERDLDRLRPWAETYLSTVPARSWPLHRLVGYCVLGDASLFERIGGLDEGVGVGNFEDDELCTRARREGGLRVVDDSLVLHVGSATFGTSHRWLRALLDGARHVQGRLDEDQLTLLVLVLAEGEPELVAQSIHSVLPLAAPVLVVDRTDAAPHLVGLQQRDVAVGARTYDWTAGDVLTDVTGVRPDATLVLLAGEQVLIDDPGAVRLGVETGRDAGAGISGLGGIRVVGPDSQLDLAALVAPPTTTLDGISSAGGRTAD